MKRILLLCIVVFAISHNLYSQNNKIVVGYYGWPDKTDYPNTVIDFTSITHICHAFLWPNSDGSLDQSQLDIDPGLITAAHNKGVKVLVSICGAGDAAHNTGMKTMVNTSAARTAFVKNLVSFILSNKYDGADFDWEYPKSDDKANYTALLTDVRSAFKQNNIPLLTAAVPSSDWNGGYDVPKLKDIFDWIGIMTYDFTGPWDPKGTPVYHNSALYGSSKQPYSIANSVAAWTGYGMPKSQICIGTPFYGYLMNASDIFIGSTSTTGEKSVKYRDIASSYLNNSGWTYNFDNSTKTPYLRNTAQTQVLTFDDTVSVKQKCDYINSNGLAGTIIWKISHSYMSAANQNPLLSIVGKYLLKSTTSSVTENTTVPEKFSLVSYPNPFNPTTTIQYAIPSQGNQGIVSVKLNVYDMLGRLVSALVNEEQSAGVHQVVFNAKDFASGIYFCKLEVGNFTKSYKLLLSK